MAREEGNGEGLAEPVARDEDPQMRWAAWRVAALGCLGAACIEAVPVRTIDGAQSGLLILEERDRRRVIAFEGRTTVPIGPEIARAAILSLACPLETYGIPEAELELFRPGTTIEGEHRHVPEPLELEGLDFPGVEPLALEEMADDRLAVSPPWQELPPVVDRNGQVVKDGGYVDAQEIAFGDQLLSRALDSPFGSESAGWDDIEVDQVRVVAWAAAPRGPDGQPRAAVLVETSSSTREIRLVERPEGRWRTVETVAAPAVLHRSHLLFASWRKPAPRYLIADKGLLHWTRPGGGWEVLSTSGTQFSMPSGQVSAASNESGWWLSQHWQDGGATLEVSPGRSERTALRFVAESHHGGIWEVDPDGKLRRRSADGRRLPIDGPRVQIRLTKAHDGAILAWAAEDILYWPAEACAVPWRWPQIGGLDEVYALAMTDAYVVRVGGGFTTERPYTEWRARPDRTPTDPLE